MGERKVLNRYVPPDFDPSIIPRFKRDKNRVMEVRMMLPFSMRCTTCGEYMGRGKKFNSRKENCEGEDYMGIRRFRFIVKCSVCSAEISFKTDPKNSDYECEYGATRNYEMWTENAAIVSEEEAARAEDEADAMKSLENRTLDSKIEMDVLDALDEIKAINQRHERVDTEHLLDSIHARTREYVEAKEKEMAAADELLVKSTRFHQQQHRRLVDSDSDQEADPPSAVSGQVNLRATISSQLASRQQQQQRPGGAAIPILKRKKRKEGPSGDQSGGQASNSTDSSTECRRGSGDGGNGVSGSVSGGAGESETSSNKRSKITTDSSTFGYDTHEQKQSTSASNSKGVDGVGSVLGGLLEGYGDSSEDDK